MATTINAREQALMRRRKLAEALQQQAMTPQQGQMVSGHYVAPGLAGMLGQLGSGLLAGQLNQSVDQEQSAIEGARRQQLMEAFGQAQQNRGDPLSVAQSLAMSENPDVAQTGMAAFGSILSQRPTAAEREKWMALPGAAPGTLFSNMGNTRVLPGVQPAPNLRNIGGEVVDLNQAIPGQLYGREPKGQQIQVINEATPSETNYGQFEKTLALDDAKKFGELRTGLEANDNTDMYLDEQEALVNEGALTGGLANPIATVNNWLGTFGVSISPSLDLTTLGNLQSSQQLKNYLTSAGGRNLTDQDLRTIKESIDLMSQSRPQEAIAVLRRWNDNDRLNKQRSMDNILRRYPHMQQQPGYNAPLNQDPRTQQPPQQQLGAPPQQRQPSNAVFVHSSDQAKYDSLPAGTVIIDENGDRWEK